MIDADYSWPYGAISIPSIIQKFYEGNVLPEPHVSSALVYLSEHAEDLTKPDLRHDLYIFLTPPDTSEWIWFEDEFTASQDKWKFQLQYKRLVSAIFELLASAKLPTDDNDLQQLMLISTFYTYDCYPWSADTTCSIASSLLSKYNSAGFVYRALAAIEDKFRSAKVHKNVTESGRPKNMNTNASQPTKRIGNVSDKELSPEWRRSLYYIATLRYCMDHGSPQVLKDHWHFLVPSILNIIDDHDVSVKSEGCRLMYLLLRNFENDQIVSNTGVLPLFWSSAKPCLLYLPPSVKSKLSTHILTQVFPTLIKIAQREPSRDRRNLKLDEIMRDGLLKGMAQAGENIELGGLLMSQLSRLISLLDIGIVRHLKPLNIVFSGILCDPFVSAYLPYLMSTVNVLKQLIETAKPRIPEYRFDIVRSVLTCYRTLHNDDNVSDTNEVDAMLKDCLAVLAEVCNSSQQFGYYHLELQQLVSNYPEFKDIVDPAA